MTDFLVLEDVLSLHADQVELYGGEHGVRDLGLLESAISQPKTTFDGVLLHRTPYEMAAAYLFHIVKNHPFFDGNKRTGAVAALVFLDINGIEINAPPGSIYELTMSVATSSASKANAAEFFQSHAQ